MKGRTVNGMDAALRALDAQRRANYQEGMVLVSGELTAKQRSELKRKGLEVGEVSDKGKVKTRIYDRSRLY